MRHMAGTESPDGAGGPSNDGRVQLTLWVRTEDRDYLQRRAGSKSKGDCAAALARIIGEARTFRHDVREKLGALDLIEMCLTSDAMTKEEAVRLISDLRREIREMIAGAGSGE